MKEAILTYLCNEPGLVCVLKRYVELVNPDSGDVIPYSYPVFVYKDGSKNSGQEACRERAIRMAACTKMKKDGLMADDVDTNFYPEWYSDSKIDLLSNGIDDDKVIDLEKAVARAWYYECMIKIDYYLTRSAKPDEKMSDTELELWKKACSERKEKFGEFDE